VLPESQNVGAGVAKHVSPTTFGPTDKNRIAPVSIQWKHLYNNGGMLLLHNGFASSCSQYGRPGGYIREKTFSSESSPEEAVGQRRSS
jgi:hypothetical protein